MDQFLKRHKDSIVGVLSCFDRVLFMGTLRSISYVEGMKAFLETHKVLLKDFEYLFKPIRFESSCMPKHLPAIMLVLISILNLRGNRKKKLPKQSCIEIVLRMADLCFVNKRTLNTLI